MLAIRGSSRAEAWLKAVKAIVQCEDWEAFHVVVEIADATKSGPNDSDVETKVNDFLVAHEAQPLQTVAETIFPASEYRRYGKEGVFEYYPNCVYSEIKDGTWGTYAYRLVRRKSEQGEGSFNPLEVCIDKLRNQLAKRPTFRSCYEIDVLDSGFDLHTYDGSIDRNRLRGGPCLSHLSFKISSDRRRLLLSATYRYHYYIERFLGNALGLGQLQKFVCNETGLEPGPILCVSSFAKVETKKWGKKEVQKLIRDVS